MQVVCIACKVPQAFTDDYKAKLNTDYTQTQNELQVLCMKGGKKKTTTTKQEKNIHKRGKMKGCKEWSVAITPWCFAIDPCRLPSWMRTLGNTAQPSCTQWGGSDHCLRLPPGKLGFNIKQEDVNQRYIAFLSQNRIKKSLCDYNS